MPVIYLGILKNTSKPAVDLCVKRNLKSFNMFTRSNYSEFIDLIVRVCAERTRVGQRVTIDKDENNKPYDYRFTVYSHEAGVCAVAVTDKDYEPRVAQAMVVKLIEAFVAKYPRSSYIDIRPAPPGSPPPLTLPELDEYIDKYQNPEDIDPVLKIQMELDQTKTFMYKNLEAVLERGEKIDTLVAKSDTLSAQSKMFYTQAKKQNSCCTVM